MIYLLLDFLHQMQPKKSEEYFEHLCNTEAGNYVWKTAEPQKSIALLRGFELPQGKVKRSGGSETDIMLDEYFNARDGWEAPGLVNYFYAMNSIKDIYAKGDKNKKGYELRGMQDYDDFLTNLTYAYADYEIWFNANYIIKYSSEKNDIKSWLRNVNKEDKLTSRYGITWRGFSRPHDREYGIAGGDLIIVDLQTNEVVAVQRNFAKARMKGNRYNWYYPLGCFELYKNDDSKKIIYPNNSTFKEKIQIISQEDNINAVQMPFVLTAIPGVFKWEDGTYKLYPLLKKVEIKNK